MVVGRCFVGTHKMWDTGRAIKNALCSLLLHGSSRNRYDVKKTCLLALPRYRIRCLGWGQNDGFRIFSATVFVTFVGSVQ